MKLLKLIVLGVLMFPAGTFAQELVVRDFQAHPGDRAATLRENTRKDRNGKTAALVKVYTPLSADEITLSGDANGFVGEDGSSATHPTWHAPGEVWMWVPGRSRAVEFTHPYGHVRFQYPKPLEAGKVYSLRLTPDGKEFSIESHSGGTTVNGVEIFIDGERKGVTPLNLFVPYGLRHVRAVKGSLTYDGNLEFSRTSTGQIRLPLEDEELRKGTVTLVADPDVEIWYEGNRLGLGTATFRDFAGAYRFETRQANADPSETTVSIKAGQKEEVKLNAPVPHKGWLAFRTVPEGVSITCEDKVFDLVNELTPGTYEVHFSKRGYNSRTRSFTVEKNSNIMDSVFLAKKQFIKKKTLYATVGYDVSRRGGVQFTIGGILAGVDLSASCTLGLQKSRKVSWFSEETNLYHNTYDYYVDELEVRLGYQLSFIERIGLTPQVGWTCQSLRGGKLGKGAKCNSATVGVRLTYLPFQHCGLFLTPQYGIAVKKGQKWEQLKPFAGLENGGFHLQAGFFFNL